MGSSRVGETISSRPLLRYVTIGQNMETQRSLKCPMMHVAIYCREQRGGTVLWCLI